jgi:hypothetical protein
VQPLSPTLVVHFDRNGYSVPASFANWRVSLRIYPKRVVVVTGGTGCASTPGSSTGRTARRDGPSTTGATIWRWSSASRVPCGMAHPLPNPPTPLENCACDCLSTRAATGNWIFWRGWNRRAVRGHAGARCRRRRSSSRKMTSRVSTSNS